MCGTNHAVRIQVSLLDISSLLDRLLPDNLNPVSIRVQDKSDVVHPTISELLLELIPSILNPLAGRLNMVNRDTGVSKSSVGLLVAVVDRVGGIILRAVVVRQFNESLPISVGLAVRHSLGAVISQEVEIKLVLRELELSNHFHANELIEFYYR